MSRSEYRKKRREINQKQISKNWENVRRGNNIAALTASVAGGVPMAVILSDRMKEGKKLTRRGRLALLVGASAYVGGLATMATDKKNRKNRRDYKAKRQALKNRYLDSRI